MKQNSHRIVKIIWSSLFSMSIALSSAMPVLAVDQNDGTENNSDTTEAEPLPSPESEETLDESTETEQTVAPETTSVQAKVSYASVPTDSELVSQNFRHYRGFGSGDPIQSYLKLLPDGRFERAEFYDDSYIQNVDESKKKGKKFIIEHYDQNYKFLDGKEIDPDSYLISGTSLSDCIWGGYYSGDEWNFVVTGQADTEEDNNKVVLRITRYTKDWEYSAKLEIANGNIQSYFDSIYVPFEAGSCRMAENNGQLWIRMARLMYAAPDDHLHHQANYTVCVNESDMSLNLKDDPLYVSHSFDQYIQAYNGNIYTVDLGDGYPRAIVLGQMDKSETNEVLKIEGRTGVNFTGAYPGDFQLGNNGQSFLISGSSVDQEATFQSGNYNDANYNAFIKVVSGNYMNDPKTIWLTDYAADSNISADRPYLVKINENKFAVLWETHYQDSFSYINTVYYCFIDAQGNKLGDTHYMEGELSECHPIVVNDKIVWYTTGAYDRSETIPTFYEININDNTNSQIPLHILVHHDEEDSTIWKTGMKEHWQCVKCLRYFLDAEGEKPTNEEELTIPKKPNWSDAVFTFSEDGKSATATRTDGNTGKTETVNAEVKSYIDEYATCTENGTTVYNAIAVFSDGRKYYDSTSRKDIPAGHDLNHYEAQEPTYENTGNKEYWYCWRCGKYFLDADAKHETTLDEVTLPMKERHYHSLDLTVESLGDYGTDRVALYDEFWTEENIRNDLDYCSYAVRQANQTSDSEQNTKGLYDQGFTFSSVEEGTYQLVVYKKGYLPHIEKISVTSDQNRGTISLRAYGDVNNDKQINITDILSVRDHVIGKTVLLGENAEAADVPINGKTDNAINIRDILQIRDRVIGKVAENYW